MNRLSIIPEDQIDITSKQMMSVFAQRVVACPPGVCPIEMQLSFLKVCHAQSCGKCIPCRVGLGVLSDLLEQVLRGEGTLETLDLIKETAEAIQTSADCAIGFDSARLVIAGLEGYKEDYLSHIEHDDCVINYEQPIPCVTLCPANVDIPGYLALAREERYEDALRLIRKDNPFPTACAMICEHPCEAKCRRTMIDAPLNIRGIKRVIVDKAPADTVPVPACNSFTGKKVAVIGGGPSGLTCAYFLQLMGHRVTVFEEKKQLGGMLRYGIPKYRLPREKLDEDINAILSTGVEVKLSTRIETEEFEQLRKEYNAIYLAIGAHTDKKLRIEGEDSKNVISAVDLLREIGDDKYPDFTDKRVIVVGGGNVAMDCCRTSVRAGAKSVEIVYRRRQEDMTALPAEIQGAIEEGVELVTLKAPVRVEANENGEVSALIVQPQMISKVRGGRPSPKNANKPEERMECDILILAVGQDIDSRPFEEAGLPTKRKQFVAETDTSTVLAGVFTGGDCQTGPASAIKAIAAGKAAAANIDEYLGFHHPITVDVKIPAPPMRDIVPCGRVNLKEEESGVRKKTFEHIEFSMSDEEALQESGRCLRCDQHGCGTLRGGRQFVW